MAEMNITIESIIHDAFSEVARTACDKFGIRVDAVSFKWIDVSTMNSSMFELESVRMDTEKNKRYDK